MLEDIKRTTTMFADDFNDSDQEDDEDDNSEMSDSHLE